MCLSLLGPNQLEHKQTFARLTQRDQLISSQHFVVDSGHHNGPQVLVFWTRSCLPEGTKTIKFFCAHRTMSLLNSYGSLDYKLRVHSFFRAFVLGVFVTRTGVWFLGCHVDSMQNCVCQELMRRRLVQEHLKENHLFGDSHARCHGMCKNVYDELDPVTWIADLIVCQACILTDDGNMEIPQYHQSIHPVSPSFLSLVNLYGYGLINPQYVGERYDSCAVKVHFNFYCCASLLRQMDDDCNDDSQRRGKKMDKLHHLQAFMSGLISLHHLPWV